MQRADYRLDKNKQYFPPLTVDNVNIERVKSTCILGLKVQENMKWNEHIHNIVKLEISNRQGMLRGIEHSSCIP